ncbi:MULTISPECIES: hypothetical protein [Streptomyces]|uniref:DUF4190 domain-containing protein n=2 Tax=Streptomyces rimosus subsp. rimosus TaxID=132474 RepID=L8EZ44_STRR1|nr:MULTISPECIES: hypothetical protein [Streptomyces]KOG69816.1 hypothetical protein ADK78_31845 [Kitasatospora aureofaciens]MYT47251.1 hypothetical protein [Streptomyces sp. SID5471]KEF02304.1 hypothetical protein DF17_34320 [Streptomyces rimosus]KEF19982.1 hypothetical protein DF18_14310 [Streptomyces rimosus]KOT28825.1 hypothetical protein ADK84_35255 [Streptomyces sp. NRRL WC-3701]
MTTLIDGSKTDTKSDTRPNAETGTAPGTKPSAEPKPAERPAPYGQADGMAVASFVLGLVGTLVANVILGPCALVLGALALARHTTRRARAMLGMVLGAADLIILATLATADGSLSWTFGG